MGASQLGVCKHGAIGRGRRRVLSLLEREPRRAGRPPGEKERR